MHSQGVKCACVCVCVCVSQVVAAAAVAAAEDASSVIDTQPLSNATEPGAVIRSFLRQVPVGRYTLDPLAAGPIVLAQRYNPHATELMPSLRRTSAFSGAQPTSAAGGGGPAPTAAPAGAAGAHPYAASPMFKTPVTGSLPLQALSKSKYLPRIIAYEPPSVQQPVPLPVLVYTEFVELPPIEAAQAAAIRAAITAARQAEAAIEEGHTKAVPFADTRSAEAQAADSEVLEQVCAM